MKKIIFLLLALVSTIILHAQTPQEDSLRDYTGKYKFPDGSVVTEVVVSLDNAVLTANSAMGSTELRKVQGDVFEIVAYNGTATFKRNAEGKVSGVQIVVGDINIEGTKTEGIRINGAASFLTSMSLSQQRVKRLKYGLKATS